VTAREAASLAAVTVETFRGLVNAPFTITPPGCGRVSAILANVTERPSPRPEWRAFSLVFQTARDSSGPRPSQGTLRIEHESLGALEVFAVALQPVGDDAFWQVVFG
jgi:hypothetical protein